MREEAARKIATFLKGGRRMLMRMHERTELGQYGDETLTLELELTSDTDLYELPIPQPLEWRPDALIPEDHYVT